MDEDIERAIVNLVKSGQQSQKNIDELNENMVVLVQAVRMRPTKKQTFGALGLLAIATFVLNLIMFGIVLSVASRGADTAKDARSSAQAIADCLDPTGGCYQQAQQNQRTNRLVISLRSEQIRLRDEIKVATILNQPEVAAARQAVLDEVEKSIRQAGENP